MLVNFWLDFILVIDNSYHYNGSFFIQRFTALYLSGIEDYKYVTEGDMSWR